MKTLTIFILFGLAPLSASDQSWWKISLTAMSAANAADVVTSLQAQKRVGCQEANQLYGRCFEARAVSLKAAYVGINAIAQRAFLKRHPKWARWFAIGNAGQAIAPAIAAAHNAQVGVH